MCGTLEMSFEDDLAVKIDDQFTCGTIKQVFWRVDVVLVNWECICNEDREGISGTAPRPTCLLSLYAVLGLKLLRKGSGQ